ncbi:hypothetical protein GCM10023116_37880 [Kistimonas scapharcae]|uniref:Uncharacterized protein n=1 Tax=Kistimonas scapharcae TaxID=1036133 RepID=A0ABP8V686_9GAMM
MYIACRTGSDPDRLPRPFHDGSTEGGRTKPIGFLRNPRLPERPEEHGRQTDREAGIAGADQGFGIPGVDGVSV